MQKKIEHFFAISHHKTIKKCFIYDPDSKRATFEFEPHPQDQFLTIAQEIKLYLRPSTTTMPAFQPIQANYSTSLLISNLQKAIRRKEHTAALSSALALIHQDPIKLIRRLPIICVEDVVALDTIPIIVWIMMAHTSYHMTPADHQLILQMVWTLCEIDVAYCCDFHKEPPLHTHSSLQKEKNADVLLALYYRTMYGGMKGDMNMLKNAIEDHKTERIYLTQPIERNIPTEMEILMEAIDFHCMPQLLTRLHNIVHLDPSIIKETIWYSESGINVRKQDTLNQSEEYQEKEEWELISKHIDRIRMELI